MVGGATGAREGRSVCGSRRFGLSAGCDRTGWRPDAVARAGRIIIIIVIIVIIVTRNRGFEGGAHLRQVGIAFRADLSSGAPWFSRHMQRGPRLGTSAGFLSECESLARPVALHAHANITNVAADSNWPNEGSCSNRGVELARLRPNHG